MAEMESALKLRRVESPPAIDDTRMYAPLKGLLQLRTHKIRGLNFLRILSPKFIVLGWSSTTLLPGVGGQSTRPRHTNVQFVKYASVQPLQHQAQAESRQTTIAITAGTNPIQSQNSPSLNPVVASVYFDDTEYPHPSAVQSAEDPIREEWHFGTTFNSQHPDTQIYGHNVLLRSSTLLERLWDDQKKFLLT